VLLDPEIWITELQCVTGKVKVKLFLLLIEYQTMNIMRAMSVSLPTFLISHSNWVTDWAVGGSCSSEGQEIFLFYEISRPAMGPTKPPLQRVLGFFPGD